MTSADEIRQDIAATRAEIAETADVLAEKLNSTAQAGKRVALTIAGAAVLIVLISRMRKARRDNGERSS